MFLFCFLLSCVLTITYSYSSLYLILNWYYIFILWFLILGSLSNVCLMISFLWIAFTCVSNVFELVKICLQISHFLCISFMWLWTSVLSLEVKPHWSNLNIRPLFEILFMQHEFKIACCIYHDTTYTEK